MSVAPFDHPFLSGLLGDEAFARQFHLDVELSQMIAFEVALAEAEAEEGVIPAEAATAIASAAGRFKPDLAALKAATARDGVAVPELVRQLRVAVGGDAAAFVHFGATSQDVLDTGLTLRLVPLLDLIEARLVGIVDALDALNRREGGRTVMAHTRMQAAIEVPAARKIAAWRDPLVRHRARWNAFKGEFAILHFGGAAGTLDRLGDKGRAVSENLARRLMLTAPERARHSERDGFAEFASLLSLTTGSLGKFGADVALLAQSEVGELRLAGGGGSSAMPHKVNPVGAEMLVTLARFNATLLSGMHQALVHEGERSGSAWTLEWMLLPQMAVATGAALRTAEEMARGLSFSR